MPNWQEISKEKSNLGSTNDIIRRKYLNEYYELTGRNVIAYYSGWLQKTYVREVGINDSDKEGFMCTVNNLDRSKGLDLFLHTPGGEIAATESIVDYLRKMFGPNIRAIIPQIAMSAGTMIACSCESIVMGKHSNLGPIDPQIGGLPAHGILEEFERAFNDISENDSKIPVWQPIIANYSPTLIGECEKAIDWSEEIVKEWLLSGMFREEEDAEEKADNIIRELGSHALTKSHDRHIHAEKCSELGLKIEELESDQKYQDSVLSVHHAFILTLSHTNAYKIIENHLGTAFISNAPRPQRG